MVIPSALGTEVPSKLYRAGFRDLISVAPPGAPLSPRTGLTASQLGKVPGKLGPDGWHGFTGWQTHEATEADVERWARWGSNIGLKAARFPAFDLDFENDKLTGVIEKRLLRKLGPAPKRLSRGARRLFVYRTDAPFRRMALDIQYEGRMHTLEVLGQGQQYLVHGVHPSGAEYRWADTALWETVPQQLTRITEGDARTLLESLQHDLEKKGIAATLRGGASRTATEPPPQELLRAPSLEALAALVRKIPNPYPDHYSYITFMYAVRAAGAEDPEGALSIFQEWAARWEDDVNDPDKVEREFRGLKPPFRVGWDWLRSEAHRLGAINLAVEDFASDAELHQAVGNPPDPRLAALEELNESYAVAQVGSDVVVLQEQQATGEVFFLAVSAFELKLRNRRIPSDREIGKMQPLTKAWLDWPGRRQYERVVFKPGEGAAEGEYNLWKGWTVEPSPDGSCERFLDHLRHVVCGGNAELNEWLLDWLAHLFQNPQEKIGIAVALRGGQGAGKSIVGAALKKLLGRYQVIADKPNQIVGNFNSHLASCLLVQAEEAFWGGSKQAAGALKHLVTGAHLLIERKGIDPVEMENYARLLITTNETLAWPTSMDDRRLAIFEVSADRVGDFEYFDAIFKELEGGGYGHLLHVLLARDIDRDRLRHAPRTAALVRQAAESMDAEEAWLLGLLGSGEVRGTLLPDGKARVALAALYDDYVGGLPRWAHQKSQQAFALFVQERLLARKLATRERVDTGSRFGVRSTMYELPPLSEVRAAYSAGRRAAPKEWDEPGEWTLVSPCEDFPSACETLTAAGSDSFSGTSLNAGGAPRQEAL